MALCQPQSKTDLARCAKWENFVKLCTVCLLPGEKMEKEREDFRSGRFDLGGDLRGHQNDQYAQCTPEDARHAMKVVHLWSRQCSSRVKLKINVHPAGVVDLQAVEQFPADCLVTDGGEHPGCATCCSQ